MRELRFDMGFVIAAKAVENVFSKEIPVIFGISLFKPAHLDGRVRPKITSYYHDPLESGDRVNVQVTLCHGEPTISIFASKAGQVDFDGFDRRKGMVEQRIQSRKRGRGSMERRGRWKVGIVCRRKEVGKGGRRRSGINRR